MCVYYYPPFFTGGAELQCSKLVREMTKRGHQCTVLTGRHDSSPAVAVVGNSSIIRKWTFSGLAYVLIKKLPMDFSSARLKKDEDQKNNAPSWFLDIQKKLSRWAAWAVRYCNLLVLAFTTTCYMYCRRNEFDVIHVHSADWLAALAALWGRLYSIPVVCKGAGVPVFPDLSWTFPAVFFNNWRRKPWYIALTPAMKDNLIGEGVRAQKITIIPNGVNIPDEISPVKQNREILYIGNFSQSVYKAFDILFPAWKGVVAMHPQARLVMLGGGDSTLWQKLCEKLGCEKSISFEGFQTDITPYLKRAACLVLPSRKEGISNALLEAQSWGVPAVVSDIPGNTEVVEHGVNGLVVSVDDVIGLSQAILRLIQSDTLRERMGKEARAKMEGNYSIEQVAGRIVALYSDVQADSS